MLGWKWKWVYFFDDCKVRVGTKGFTNLELQVIFPLTWLKNQQRIGFVKKTTQHQLKHPRYFKWSTKRVIDLEDYFYPWQEVFGNSFGDWELYVQYEI